jgi:hypothetical protein
MKITSWNFRLTTEDTNAILWKIARRHIDQISGQNERAVLSSYCNVRDARALNDYILDYAVISVSDAYHIRQAQALFQKRQDLDLGIDKEAVAYTKFLQAEEDCRLTNDIFRQVASGSFMMESDVNSVLYRAQRKIATMLGDVPQLSDLKPHFGPGATTQVHKKDASALCKLGQTHACSGELSQTAKYCLEELQGWIFSNEDPDTATLPLEIHPGKLCFVPKTAKTHRAIVVEPSLNSMFQLGIGDYLSRRFRKFGLDLSDQTPNQRAALEGSLTGELATLDLSSASDTIASGLVQSLLPVDWFLFLSQFRTGSVSYNGDPILLQKFSSMGNGFTFPLESLIFFALTTSVCETKEELASVSVYGDDIIVPTKRAQLLKKILNVCGFTVNVDKSFTSGPFRESCGKDFLKGIDIRPVYVKDRLSGEDAFVLHNYYVRTMQPDMASFILSFLDPSFLIWGPDGFGDGHLIGDHLPLRRKKHKDVGFHGYTFETYSWKGRKSFDQSAGLRFLPSYSIYASPSQEGLPGLPGHIWNKLSFLSDRYRGCRTDVKNCYNTIPTQFSHRYLDRRKMKRYRLGVPIPGRDQYKRISIYTY